jgi:hypothetical protein
VTLEQLLETPLAAAEHSDTGELALSGALMPLTLSEQPGAATGTVDLDGSA